MGIQEHKDIIEAVLSDVTAAPISQAKAEWENSGVQASEDLLLQIMGALDRLRKDTKDGSLTAIAMGKTESAAIAFNRGLVDHPANAADDSSLEGDLGKLMRRTHRHHVDATALSERLHDAHGILNTVRNMLENYEGERSILLRSMGETALLQERTIGTLQEHLNTDSENGSA
jgi:hypothetical protein